MGAWLLLMIVFNFNGQYEFKQPMPFDSKAACQQDEKLFKSIKIPKDMENEVKFHHMVSACVRSESDEEFSDSLKAILRTLPKESK